MEASQHNIFTQEWKSRIQLYMQFDKRLALCCGPAVHVRYIYNLKVHMNMYKYM